MPRKSLRWNKKKCPKKVLFIENYACGSSKVNGCVVDRIIFGVCDQLINMLANWKTTDKNKNGICCFWIGSTKIFLLFTLKRVFKWSEYGSFIKMKSENYWRGQRFLSHTIRREKEKHEE